MGDEGLNGGGVGGGAGYDCEQLVQSGLRDRVCGKKQVGQFLGCACYCEGSIGAQEAWGILRATAERPSLRVFAKAFAVQPPVAPRKAVSSVEDIVVVWSVKIFAR
jgi:hypothetical protein